MRRFLSLFLILSLLAPDGLHAWVETPPRHSMMTMSHAYLQEQALVGAAAFFSHALSSVGIRARHEIRSGLFSAIRLYDSLSLRVTSSKFAPWIHALSSLPILLVIVSSLWGSSYPWLSIPLGLICTPLYDSTSRKHRIHDLRQDALTGLPNRNAAELWTKDGLYNHAGYLPRLLRRAWRNEHPVTLVMMDIDFFKSVNDTYGHAMGDLIIREVAQRIKKALRGNEDIFRWGGEEFLLVLKTATIGEAWITIERVLDDIRQIEIPAQNGKAARRITASAGIAFTDAYAVPPESQGVRVKQILKSADQALYRAKEQGRNQSQFANDLFQSPEHVESLDFALISRFGLAWTRLKDAATPLPGELRFGRLMFRNLLYQSALLTLALSSGLALAGHSPLWMSLIIHFLLQHFVVLNIHQRRRMEREVIDAVTGLRKRNSLGLDQEDGYLPRLVEFSLTTKEQSLSTIFIDLDRFKSINDTYGHEAGDHVLRAVSDLIFQHLKRDQDEVFRYGGEEFLVVLPRTDLAGAQKIAEEIRLLIEQAHISIGDGRTVNVTASLGVAEATEEQDWTGEIRDSVYHWIKRADVAHYLAKGNGRNRVVVSPAVRTAA